MTNLQKNMSQWPASVEPIIKIIGYFPGKMAEKYIKQAKKGEFISHAFLNMNSKCKKNKNFKPMSIAAEGGCVAIADSQQRLWLVTDISDEPICITELLKLKIELITINHNQLVLKNREEYLLLSWGGRKTLSQNQLIKIPIKNSKHKLCFAFELYRIKNNSRNILVMTPNHNTSEQNWLFSMSEDNSMLIGYPLKTTVKVPTKIRGLSVGKHIKLYWDQIGNLFSWGCRSIALGYGTLPSEEQINEPQKISQLNHVVNAYAGKHYCLAITSDGKLYEWGIKKTSSMKEELIFTPRQIILQPAQRFVDLKGKDDKYAVLTLSGKLFIWGRGTQQFISKNILVSETENYLFNPKQLPEQYGYIHDFSLTQSFIALISTKQQCTALSNNRKQYWQHFKQNLKDGLRLREIVRTEQSESRSKRYCLVEFKEPLKSNSKIRDPVEEALNKIRSKEKYIQAAADDEKIFKYILQTSKTAYCFEKQNLTEENLSAIEKRISHKKSNLHLQKMLTAVDQLNKEFNKEKQYVKKMLNNFARKTDISYKNSHFEAERPFLKTSDTQTYNSRRQAVLSKRKANQKEWMETTVRKLESRSYDFRQRIRKQRQSTQKQNKQNYFFLENMQKLLIKHYLLKMVTNPLAKGREALIEIFSKHLKFERVERHIRGLFLKTKIRLRLKNMRSKYLGRFFLLIVYFQKYVKRFRQKTYKKHRQTAVNQIFKSVIKDKLRIGLATCKFNVKKLQKFREWLSMVKKQQKKCLKTVWKIQLLTVMRISSEHENTVVSHLPRHASDVSVQAIYNQKLSMYPELQLSQFLNQHSIFRIKAGYFQKMMTMFFEESKKVRPSKKLNILKKKHVTRRRTRIIKFMREEQEERLDRFNLSACDILPFSLHYNIFMHSKNYDVPVPEIMKQSQRWIKEERLIFEKQLDEMLLRHEKEFRKKRKQYDIQLANYIRKKYDKLAEKRWQYILQYNKLQKTVVKTREEKQLKRLLRLIGAEHLLQTDFIPQKHTILQEAKHQRDAPQPPNNFIEFGPIQFKKQFKAYCEAILIRMKQLRRSFF